MSRSLVISVFDWSFLSVIQLPRNLLLSILFQLCCFSKPWRNSRAGEDVDPLLHYILDFGPPHFFLFSNITPPNILSRCQLWDFVSLPEKCSSVLHLLRVLPEFFAPSIGDSTIDLAVLALEVRLSNREVLLVIRCFSCSSSLSGSYDFTFFFFFPTSASFFQNPTFADALAPVVLLVQHAGKVKEKIFFFFLLFFLKRVRFAGVWSLAMICSQVKAWGKLEKLFCSQCCVVIGSSVLPSQLRNF